MMDRISSLRAPLSHREVYVFSLGCALFAVNPG